MLHLTAKTCCIPSETKASPFTLEILRSTFPKWAEAPCAPHVSFNSKWRLKAQTWILKENHKTEQTKHILAGLKEQAMPFPWVGKTYTEGM